jgi:hypothetical protein
LTKRQESHRSHGVGACISNTLVQGDSLLEGWTFTHPQGQLDARSKTLSLL